MTIAGWLQAALVFGLVCACVKPLGIYMARVFQGERVVLSPRARAGRAEPLPHLPDRRRARDELAGLCVRGAGLQLGRLRLLYALLRTQAFLPLNPQGFGNLAPDLAWNTAVSFMTNTNWQFYSGESTMSYLSQMAGLGWHMFVSAATGIAIAVALMRGLVAPRRRRPSATSGST